MNLYTSQINKKYLINEMPDNNLIKSLGVFNGSVILKKATYKHGGPVLLDVDGREVAIGKDIAINIKVSEVKE